MGLVYLAAAGKAARTMRWPVWKTISFIAGMAVLVIGLTLDARGAQAHMRQHVLIGMIAPIGLALGCPVTLALRTMPRILARFVARSLHARVFRVAMSPAFLLLLNLGAMAGLYLTPAFAFVMSRPPLLTLFHVHFVVAGFLFASAVIGHEKVIRPCGFRCRLVILFIGSAGHAVLAKVLYAETLPRIPGVSHLDIQASAQIMYYGGDLAELLLAVALFAVWFRDRRRSANSRGRAHHQLGSQHLPRAAVPAAKTGLA